MKKRSPKWPLDHLGMELKLEDYVDFDPDRATASPLLVTGLQNISAVTMTMDGGISGGATAVDNTINWSTWLSGAAPTTTAMPPISPSSWPSWLANTLADNLTALAANSTELATTLLGAGLESSGGGHNLGLLEVTDNSIQLGRCDNGSDIFNCTVEEYLEYLRGPQTLPVQQAIIVTIVYVIIFLTGVIGNVIVCVVIVRHSTMHTATNYYLFSLAVSDLLFLLMGVPNEIALYWRQYPYAFGLSFCKMRALISEASTYVSVLTIVAFTMERFLAICHPLHLYTMSGFKRALRIIAALWCISFLSAAPFAVYTKIDILKYPVDESDIPDSAFCAMLTGNPNGFPLWEVSTCVFFVIPMTVILLLYVRIGLRIRSRTKHTQALGVTQGSLQGESRQQQSRKAIIRMLAAVVITFFVCWAPFHAQRLLYLHGQQWEHYKTANEWIFVFGGTLYYVSCTINPILYNVMSHRYRIAFKETLCGRRRSYFHNNGFLSTNQSSFRETIIADGGGGNLRHEGSRLLRIKSVLPGMRCASTYKDRNRQKTGEGATGATGNTGDVNWKERINIHAKVIKDEKLPLDNNDRRKSDVLVVLENNRNGRTKCYSTSAAALIRPKSPAKPPALADPVAPVALASSGGDLLKVPGLGAESTNGAPLAQQTTTNGRPLPSIVLQGVVVGAPPADLSPTTGNMANSGSGIAPPDNTLASNGTKGAHNETSI